MNKIYSLLLLVPFISLPAIADEQCPGREWKESKVQYILEIPKNGNPQRFQCQKAGNSELDFICDNGIKVFLQSQKLEDKVGNSFGITPALLPGAEIETSGASIFGRSTISGKIEEGIKIYVT